MKYATWDEVAPLLTQEATTMLMGATLRGDRMAMREALDMLAALVPGGGRHEALVTFVRYLIALAGCMCEALPEDVETAIEVVEQLPVDALEEYAHQFAWLVYTVGTAERGTTIN